MEHVSLKSLTDMADRAERLAARLPQLDLAQSDIQVPPPPVPLTLNATEDWLASVDEWLRKPRRARSKQLLESKGIDTTSIPASVLDDPDPLTQIISRLDGLPSELQSTAYASIGRALTKGTEDASIIADRLSGTADAIRKLGAETAEHAWIYAITIGAVSGSPDTALNAVNEARRVLQLARAIEQRGIRLGGFETLAHASQALAAFNARFAEYHQLLATEGIVEEGVACNALDIQEAQRRFDDHRQGIMDEKLKLQHELLEFNSQLQAVGGQYSPSGERLADLRKCIGEIGDILDLQRSKLRESLGADTFKVIEPLLQGGYPSESDVSDAEFGNALRRAVSCGYRIQMDVPHESQ